MTVHKRVEQIYEAERSNIYSYLLNLGLPAARAQESTQDAFLKLYLKMSKGEAIESPRAWLYRVAHNLALRSFQREPQFDALDPNSSGPDTTQSPEHALIEDQRK